MSIIMNCLMFLLLLISSSSFLGFTVQADNVLNLLEPVKTSSQSKSTSIQSEQCHLSEIELKPLLLIDDSQSIENKYILIKKDSVENSFLEQIRSTLPSLDYKICTIDFTNQLSINSNISVLIQRGHLIPYYGQHDSNTLIRFISHLEQRLSQSPYQTIESKMDKKAYEHILEPKIIAYFPDVTAPAFLEYERAAKIMGSNPPFFVVNNPQFASKFRLNQPGQISLVRRLEKSQLFFSKTSQPTNSNSITTAEEIVNWIQNNRGLVLHELKDTNLYDPELLDVNKYQLVAVGDKSSPMGLYFFKILTKTIQNISRENEMKLNPTLTFEDDVEEVELKPESSVDSNVNEKNDSDVDVANQPIRLDDIEIVWIDSIQYPNAALNMKHRYQIPTFKNVWFGLIHAPANASTVRGLQSVWFGLDTLNVTRSDRKNDEQNILLVRNWILTVTDRNPNLEQEYQQQQQQQQEQQQQPDIEINPFVLEPEPVSVRKGGNFILECKVRTGLNCKWEKDSLPINVDGIRIRFVQQTSSSSASTNDDCSIMINGADNQIDQGQWTCLVTMFDTNLNNERSISSKSILVTIRDNQMKNEL